MAKITLAKALKTKNRIASRIAQVKKQMMYHNVYLVDKTHPDIEINIQVDVRALKTELETLTKNLICVKAAISKGNVESATKIFELSEAKGLLSWYEHLDCSEGRLADSYLRTVNPGEIQRAQIGMSEKNEIIKELIAKIEKTQDELDEFNASHRVDIDDSIF
jgi:hypothetical protein